MAELWRGDDGSMIVVEPDEFEIDGTRAASLFRTYFLAGGRTVTYWPEPVALPRPPTDR